MLAHHLRPILLWCTAGAVLYLATDTLFLNNIGLAVGIALYFAWIEPRSGKKR